jgi:hypothetical protein
MNKPPQTPVIKLEPLQVGDLVKFEAVGPFTVANDRYSSNGVVVSIRDAKAEFRQVSYSVVWSDGRETNEWRCYLKKLT